MNTTQTSTPNMQNETLLDNDIPAKFKDPQTGAVKMDALAKSYKELEAKLSSLPKLPKTPDEYDVKCVHGLFTSDDEINKRLYEKGFTNDQVQMVYDLAAEVMVPMIVNMAGDFQADREVEKLIEHFGGVDKWQEMARQLLAFGQKNLPADVLDTLSSSYDEVLALYRMMNNQEPMIGVKSSDSAGGDQGLDLQTMMRDPKYWREKDPSFVAKVTEGFQRLYTDK